MKALFFYFCDRCPPTHLADRDLKVKSQEWPSVLATGWEKEARAQPHISRTRGPVGSPHP